MKPSKSFELTLSKISYTFVIIALTFTLALLRYEITFMVIILGAILNVVAIIFSFQHGYFGGAFSFLAHTSGGIANLVMFIDMPNFFFLSVAIFSFSNVLVCIFIAHLSELRSKREAELIRINRIDSLTNVYNHRHFQKLIQEVFHICENQSEDLSLILLDIDNFKMINDYFGHAIGDEILVEISTIIKKTIREDDMVFRYGGDEFIVLLPGIDIKNCEVVSARILSKIAAYKNQFITKIIPNYEVTASIGISSYPILCDNYNNLVHQADMALYDSKYAGRNNYAIYDNITDSFLLKPKEYNNYFKSLLILIDSKDHYTYGHSIRVSQYAYELGVIAGFDKLELSEIKAAGLLHDIGKIEIPEEILSKNDQLTHEEYTIIKEHSIKSTTIVKSFISQKSIIEAIEYHHERYDGTGYPSRLKGDEIPQYAKILALADSYDAMRSNRVYSKGLSISEAIKEIEAHSGSQFDQVYADLFVKMIQSNNKTSHSNFIYNQNDQNYNTVFAI